MKGRGIKGEGLKEQLKGGYMADSWEAKAREIVKQVRSQIKEVAGRNPDDWFKINRYVYARLLLDE